MQMLQRENFDKEYFNFNFTSQVQSYLHHTKSHLKETFVMTISPQFLRHFSFATIPFVRI